MKKGHRSLVPTDATVIAVILCNAPRRDSNDSNNLAGLGRGLGTVCQQGASRAGKTLQRVKPELQEGYQAVSGNRLADARDAFKPVLRSLLLTHPTSDTEPREMSDRRETLLQHCMTLFYLVAERYHVDLGILRRCVS